MPPPTALSPRAQGQKNHSSCPALCQQLTAGPELLKTQLKQDQDSVSILQKAREHPMYVLRQLPVLT